eukprot:767681-Rhodomonas_salina.1
MCIRDSALPCLRNLRKDRSFFHPLMPRMSPTLSNPMMSESMSEAMPAERLPGSVPQFCCPTVRRL